MTRKILSVFLALLLCLCVAFCVSAGSVGQSFVMDEAGLLSDSEITQLDARLQDISSLYRSQVVIMTVPYLNGIEIDDFIEDTYDGMKLGYGSTRDGVLLVVCMDPREYRILTNGMADEAIGGSGIEIIGDNIVSDLSDGDYADAFRTFADDCEYYLNGYLNGFPFDPGATLLISLVIGLIVGVIVVLILKGQLKSVRQQNQANVYVTPGSMQLTASNEFFLYRTLNRRKKESSSSGSRRGGSSRSVGGGSF